MSGRRKPDAKLPLGFTSIKLYGDRVESRWGSGSIAGATAHVDSTGNKGLLRDSRQSFLTIEGPDVNVVVKVGNSATVQRLARSFAAKLNSNAMRLAHEAQAPHEAGAGREPQRQSRGRYPPAP